MATHSIFLPGESHGQRSLEGCIPWGCKESDTTEQLIRTNAYRSMSPPPQSNTELPAHQGVPSKEASAFQTEIAFFPFWFKKEELAGSEDGGEWRSRRREQWERHGAGVSTERVIAGFNRLGQDQRGLASKAAELAMELDEHSAVTDTLKEVAMELDEHSAVTDTLKEAAMELVEHSAVTDTLKEADETRKCCLMLGGVLGERTVQEALPALGNYKEQIQKITDADTTASGKGKRTK